MRKVSTLLCVAMVLYAVPAFGERIIPKDRNVDRSGKTFKKADSAIPISEAQGRAAVVGIVYSNFDYYNGYIVPPGCLGCAMYDDYDSINDAPFIQGQFGFLGGVVAGGGDDGTGVVWFTFFDSLGSFVASSGWLLGSGLFIYSFDHTGLDAADAGFAQFYPSSGYWNPGYEAYGIWLANSTGPTIGTEDPTVGGPDEVNSYLFSMEAVELGYCCIPLTGACSYGPESACAGVFTASELGCDPNPCPPGTCGNGDLDEGEECDDGNTEPGDGCDALCREEIVYIPAVSEWGLLVMALLGLTVGTVLFGRRRAVA